MSRSSASSAQPIVSGASSWSRRSRLRTTLTGFQPQGGSASLFLRYFPFFPFFPFLPFSLLLVFLLLLLALSVWTQCFTPQDLPVRQWFAVQVLSPFSRPLWGNMTVDEVSEPAANFIQRKLVKFRGETKKKSNGAKKKICVTGNLIGC